MIPLDWSGVDLTPKFTPYAEEAVELQDSNMAPDQIYTVGPLTGLAGKHIYKMLYEEESKGLKRPHEDIYKMAYALSRDLSCACCGA